MPERELVVTDPGGLTTIQDLGRPGYAHLGVPRSGALDTPAMLLANRMVGNPEPVAVLETNLTGVAFTLTRASTLAVTGARASVVVDGREAGWGRAVPVPAGALVRVGPALRGVRSYVAVAGGIEVEPVLGSRSTDVLSGLGPAPLEEGARLPIGASLGTPSGAEVVQARPPADEDLIVSLRVRPGPREAWFAPAAMDALGTATYTISAESNRIGLRLQGPVLDRAVTTELPSEGMVLGAIQVPPSGQPVLFLNDHPTTGGYPVIAVVVEADLPACAQLRPGDAVRFRVLAGR